MVIKSHHSDQHIIKWRSHEPTRLETFSDAVFAFAVTLVIVSLEVPKTFVELNKMMKGFMTFAACFAMIFYLWNIQNTFFRRYGLKDNYTTFLNALLLFMVLLYVYPLKFLFNIWFLHEGAILPGQTPQLMLIYDCGYGMIFLLFFLMYTRAHSLAGKIGLSEKEKYQTNTHRFGFLFSVVIAMLALAIAFILPARISGLSGFTYCLLSFMGFWHGKRADKMRSLFKDESGEGQ